MKTKLLLMTLLTLVGVSSSAYSAATVEVSRDAGVIGNPFQFGNAGYDPQYPDATAPEGQTVLRLGVNGGGGWGTGNNGVSDYSGYSDLRFWLKSNNTIKIEIQHSGSLKSGVDIPSTGGVWKEIVLRLDASGPAPKFDTPVNVSNVSNLFLASNYTDAGNNFWEFDHIRWTKPVTSLAIFPASAQVNAGHKRQFTVEGRNGTDPVIIYSSFTATSGVVSPPAPVVVAASTLTASDSTSMVAQLGPHASAPITVTADNLDSTFGLLSETVSGINLGTDSTLGVDQGSGSIQAGDSPDSVEGNKSFVSTVSVSGSGFAGWYIAWGQSGDQTRDMSNYYEGSIRFWFKGAPSLAGKIKCGIRSSNVTPGTELSAVLLDASYASDSPAYLFDGHWHPVQIPMSKLAGARPWADISRTQVLFSAYAAVSDGTGANGAFYIDKLRWDTRLPGPLVTIEVRPAVITLPLNAKRVFSARGLDAAGGDVDILPTWLTNVPGGSVTPGPSSTTLFTAPSVAASGGVTANVGGINGGVSIGVAPLDVKQSYNVYSDAGAGGTVGVSQGGAPGTALSLQEPNTGSVEGVRFFHSTYTLLTDSSHLQAYANWYVEETNNTRFMNDYGGQNGYLQFYVRTPVDLVFGIRSSNITPGTENSKFTLSELGVPLDNQWQFVVVSIADLKAREPNLDLTRIQTYFAITAQSDVSGTNSTPRAFDVDDVKWVTSTPPPDGTEIYAGLLGKQNSTSGLVLSFDQDPALRAVTYDNALAAMAFTYHKDFVNAKAILNAYKGRYDSGAFAGFHDNYKWDVANTATVVAPDQRTAGPNAWLLLAILHYKNATFDNTFDAMAGGIAAWLKTLQTPDGGIQFGYIGSTLQTNKSTEHNFDAYAAFDGYAKDFNSPAYAATAASVRGWLDTKAWTGSRFLVGRTPSDQPNSDRALDVYSWAPLALSSFTSVLTNPINGAEVSFSTKNVNVNTGLLVDGFDFSSFPSANANNDAPADKDAVWLEGTAQMALAYALAGDTSKWNYYLGQLGFAIFNTGDSTQGLTYATNPGSAYGANFTMDATHAAASSMAWYLFATNKFNPFHPFAIESATVKRISDNVAASSVTWSVTVPVPNSQRWKLANHYIELSAQPITTDVWGIQIYTDNTNPAATMRYVDPTPANTINNDSNPAGLLHFTTNPSTTSEKLDLAWRIQDTTAPIPSAVQPATNLSPNEGPEAGNWFYFMDRATPAIDSNNNGVTGDPDDGVAFQDGQVSYAIIRTPQGIQAQQPGSNGVPVYTPSTNPDYIYLEANFATAAAQEPYEAPIVIEFFKT
jgi:hypothetical protein